MLFLSNKKFRWSLNSNLFIWNGLISKKLKTYKFFKNSLSCIYNIIKSEKSKTYNALKTQNTLLLMIIKSQKQKISNISQNCKDLILIITKLKIWMQKNFLQISNYFLLKTIPLHLMQITKRTSLKLLKSYKFQMMLS